MQIDIDAPTLPPERLIEVIEPLQVKPAEAAKIMRVAISTIYEMLNRGELEYTEWGRSRFIPMDSLRAWIARNRRQGR
jgi:excisionase family DNA binding protein